MQYHYGLLTGAAIPSNIYHRYLALWNDSIVEQMANVATPRPYKTFCVNDVGLQSECTDEVNEAVVNFLNSYFPNDQHLSCERRKLPPRPRLFTEASDRLSR